MLGAKTLRGASRYATPGIFRYVGLGEDLGGETFHTFEWGHGWTVKIPDRQLLRPSRDGSTLGLFHGDRITAVTLSRRGGQLAMTIDPASVRPGLPGQVYREADSAVVHQLRVEVNQDAGTVRVRTVLTGNREITRRQSVRAGHKPINARLSGPSVDRLLASVRPASQEPVIRDVLARLDKRLFSGTTNGQGRRLDFIYIPVKPDPDGQEGAEKTDDSRPLGRGDRLFLLSGAIRATMSGNDVLMEFTPPADFMQDEAQLTVEVFRRSYSHREGLLPQLLAAQQAGNPSSRR